MADNRTSKCKIYATTTASKEDGAGAKFTQKDLRENLACLYKLHKAIVNARVQFSRFGNDARITRTNANGHREWTIEHLRNAEDLFKKSMTEGVMLVYKSKGKKVGGQSEESRKKLLSYIHNDDVREWLANETYLVKAEGESVKVGKTKYNGYKLLNAGDVIVDGKVSDDSFLAQGYVHTDTFAIIVATALGVNKPSPAKNDGERTVPLVRLTKAAQEALNAENNYIIKTSYVAERKDDSQDSESKNWKISGVARQDSENSSILNELHREEMMTRVTNHPFSQWNKQGQTSLEGIPDNAERYNDNVNIIPFTSLMRLRSYTLASLREGKATEIQGVNGDMNVLVKKTIVDKAFKNVDAIWAEREAISQAVNDSRPTDKKKTEGKKVGALDEPADFIQAKSKTN